MGLIPSWFAWATMTMLPAYLFSLQDAQVLELWASVLSLHPSLVPEV